MIRISCVLSFVLALSACVVAQEPDSDSTAAPTESTVVDGLNGPCPIQWTCDRVNWFTSFVACNTSSACAGKGCEPLDHQIDGCTPR